MNIDYQRCLILLIMLFLMILSWWLLMFMMTVFTLLTSMSNCLQRKSKARRSSILFTLPLLFRSTLSNTYRKSFVMIDHMKMLVYGWICTFFAKPFGSENQFWGRPLLVLSGGDFALDWSEKTCLAKKDLPGQIFFHFPALSSQTSRPVIGVQ